MTSNRLLTFTLTDQHIKLLRKMYVGWQDCETGAPEIDPKRPYGNSAVAEDVAFILDEPYDPEADEDSALNERMLAIHRETETALQIVLASGSFTPGVYTRSETWQNDWTRDEG
jgi:hypothetical protein